MASACTLTALSMMTSHRHLLAEVEHRVAVVDEDRLDEVLADVVHVAEDRRRTTFPLVTPFGLLEVTLEARHAFFIASADWRTNGRISSPEPNFSPTSFMAGSRTWLSTCTAIRRRSRGVGQR